MVDILERRASDDPLGWSSRRKAVVTAGVMLGMFLAALEATVVNTAMPTIIATLGGLRIYPWAFSIYLVAQTVTVPLWGRLSDMYGRRPFYLASIGLFIAGSVLCGFSESMTQLIVFRAIQGLGGGGLIPLAMTVIGELYSLEQRAKMQGLFSGVWGLASIAGPIVGGFLTDQVSWRWVFFINLPFGVLAVPVLWVGLRARVARTQARPDYLGAALLGGAITLLLLTLLDGGAASWFEPSMLLRLAGAGALLVLFGLQETRCPEPLIPPSLFRNRMVLAATVNGFLAGVAVFGIFNYVPLFVQAVIGTSATKAGGVLTPMMLSWVTMSIVGGRLILRSGYRVTVVAGTLLLALGAFGLSRLTPAAAVADVVLANIALGSGMGLTMVTFVIAVQNAVPRSQLGIVTSGNMFFRQIGGAIGVAAFGTVLTAGLHGRLASLAAQRPELAPLLRDPDAIVRGGGAGLPLAARTALREALGHSLHGVFRASLAVALLMLVAVWMVPRGRARELADQYQGALEGA